MTVSDFLAVLDLPQNTRVDVRVSKKLLIEHSGTQDAEKCLVAEGVEEIRCLAKLTSNAIGVVPYTDATRDYPEIDVLHVRLREHAVLHWLEEWIHRSMPNPIVLLASQEDILSLSVAHKSRSKTDNGAMALDNGVIAVDLSPGLHPDIWKQAAGLLSLARQPHSDMQALYQGWLDVVVALQAAEVTGVFALAETAEHAEARRKALLEHALLEQRIADLKASAAREYQRLQPDERIPEVKRLRELLAATREKL